MGGQTELQGEIKVANNAAYNKHKIANVSSLLYWPTVLENNVLSRTKQGSSAVPVGSVVDRTLLGSM